MSDIHTLNMEIVSDKPLPDNIVEMSEDISNVTMVAIIARESVHSESDVTAILHAVFLYSDGKGYDRGLVGQIINQLIKNITTNPIMDETTNGN